jgi:hypothetical protein
MARISWCAALTPSPRSWKGTGTNLRLPFNPPFNAEFEGRYDSAGLQSAAISNCPHGLTALRQADPFVANIRLWDPFVRPANTQQWNSHRSSGSCRRRWWPASATSARRAITWWFRCRTSSGACCRRRRAAEPLSQRQPAARPISPRSRAPKATATSSITPCRRSCASE